MFKVLFCHASDWKTIGGLLGVEMSRLDSIERNEAKVNERLQAMLSEWLKNLDPLPTWNDIVDAVKTIGNVELAEEIQTVYIRE